MKSNALVVAFFRVATLIAVSSLSEAKNFAPARKPANDLPVCRAELIAPRCRDLSKSPLDLRTHKSDADGVLFNYFHITKSKHAGTLRKYASDVSESDRKRTMALTEEARKHAIRYLTGNRPEDQWSEETKRLVLRVNALTFRVSDASSGDCYDSGDPGIPQAAYSPSEHSVGVCNSMAKTNSEMIMTSLLHEIGHALSPCNMKRKLVRHNEVDDSLLRCLSSGNNGLSTSSGGEDPSEYTGAQTQIVTHLRDVKYSVEMSSENTDMLIRCGAAERVLDSDLKEVASFRAIESCLQKRYANDYENYVAWSTIRVDVMPRGLIPREVELISNFKKRNPLECYQKCEEHFADSFSAQALASWLSANNRDQRGLRLALHDLASSYCVGRVENKNISNPHIYPLDEDRLLTYLTPKANKALLGCIDLSKKNFCALPDDLPFAGISGSRPGTRSDAPTDSRGTAP